MNRWPNTFIAGVPKGGTTALAAILSQHPDVYIPRKKEPRYYSFMNTVPAELDIVNKHVITDSEHYASLFSNSPAKILIDASPGYYCDKNAPKLIRRDAPDAKFIILLRDPVERVFSHFWFAVQKGFEPSDAKFEDIFSATDVTTPNGFVRRRNYLNSSIYVEHLDRLFNVFSREQVYVTTSEHFIVDPIGVLGNICQFLRIPLHSFSSDIGEKAKSGVPKSRLVHYVALFLIRNMERATNRLPRLVPSYLLEKSWSIHNKNLVKPQMAIETRQKMIDFFSASVRELSCKYSIDVRYWRNFHAQQ